GGAVAVGGGVARGDVVGARQVVVRQGLQVEDVVVAFLGADGPRGFVERVADEEMGAGEYPLFRVFGELSFTLHSTVLLGVDFVPVLRGVVLPFHVTQPSGLGGEFVQYHHQLPGVQGRQ